MRIQGAVVREQGVTFAVVSVKPMVVNNRARADETVAAMQVTFGGLPVVLMAQSAGGCPTFYGRQDIARFLSSVPISALPWKWYSIH